MADVYHIDLATDIIRGQHNFGERRLIEDLSLDQVKDYVNEYNDNFGTPTNVAGMLVWVDKHDSYCLSIYKNNKAFELQPNNV